MEDKRQSSSFFDQLNTDTSGVLSGCWDHKCSGGVEHFRANILNLKLELQSLKKGNESVNGFLQKIKIARDKLLAVGVVVDNEELICIVLRGLPKDFAHFCSAIRTRNDPISYEQLSIMLQSEEQAMMEVSESVPHSLAMYASNFKPNGNGGNSQSNQGSTRGRGRNNFNRGRGGGRSNNYTPHSQGSTSGNSGFYNTGSNSGGNSGFYNPNFSS